MDNFESSSIILNHFRIWKGGQNILFLFPICRFSYPFPRCQTISSVRMFFAKRSNDLKLMMYMYIDCYLGTVIL